MMNYNDENNCGTPSSVQNINSPYTESAMEYDSFIDPENTGLLNTIGYKQQQPRSINSGASGSSTIPGNPKSPHSGGELSFLDADTTSNVSATNINESLLRFSVPTRNVGKKLPVFEISKYNTSNHDSRFKLHIRDEIPVENESQQLQKASSYKQYFGSSGNIQFDDDNHHNKSNHRYDVNDLFVTQSETSSLLFSPHSNSNLNKSNIMYKEQESLTLKKLTILLMELLIFTLISALCLLFFRQKYLNNPLAKFNVEGIESVLLNEDILLFDISSTAVNINYEEIKIWDLDLDVLLITDSQNLESNENFEDTEQDQVVILLGNVERFQTPLTFPGTFYKYKLKPHKASAEVRLYKPAEHFKYNDNYLNSQQWQRILNANHTLVVRGELKYQIPFCGTTELLGINYQTPVTT